LNRLLDPSGHGGDDNNTAQEQQKQQTAPSGSPNTGGSKPSDSSSSSSSPHKPQTESHWDRTKDWVKQKVQHEVQRDKQILKVEWDILTGNFAQLKKDLHPDQNQPPTSEPPPVHPTTQPSSPTTKPSGPTTKPTTQPTPPSGPTTRPTPPSTPPSGPTTKPSPPTPPSGPTTRPTPPNNPPPPAPPPAPGPGLPPLQLPPPPGMTGTPSPAPTTQPTTQPSAPKPAHRQPGKPPYHAPPNQLPILPQATSAPSTQPAASASSTGQLTPEQAALAIGALALQIKSQLDDVQLQLDEDQQELAQMGYWGALFGEGTRVTNRILQEMTTLHNLQQSFNAVEQAYHKAGLDNVELSGSRTWGEDVYYSEGKGLQVAMDLAQPSRAFGMESASILDTMTIFAPLFSGLVGAANLSADEILSKLGFRAAEKAGAGYATSSIQAQDLARQLTSEEQVGQALSRQGKPLIGPGTSKTLDDAGRLARQYGGDPADWAKMGSKSSAEHGVQTSAGKYFETHWYQNIKTGQVVEIKTKIEGH
jgi:hypothetical protein